MSTPPAEAGPPIAERSDIGQFAIVPVWMLDMGLNGGEIKNLVALLTWVNRESGEAWPRIKEIADRAKTSETTTERALARLRELKIISSEIWLRPDGSIGGSSYYVFMVRPAARASPGPPDTSPTAPNQGAQATPPPGDCEFGTIPMIDYSGQIRR